MSKKYTVTCRFTACLRLCLSDFGAVILLAVIPVITLCGLNPQTDWKVKSWCENSWNWRQNLILRRVVADQPPCLNISIQSMTNDQSYHMTPSWATFLSIGELPSPTYVMSIFWHRGGSSFTFEVGPQDTGVPKNAINPEAFETWTSCSTNNPNI